MTISIHPVAQTRDPAFLILSKVAVHSGLTVGELVSKRRAAEHARPRQLAYYLFTQLTGWSHSKIALHFNRDHTTVMHGVRAFKRRMGEDPEASANARRIEAEILQLATQEMTAAAAMAELRPVAERGTGVAASEFRRIVDLAFEVDPVGSYRRIYDALLPLAKRRAPR